MYSVFLLDFSLSESYKVSVLFCSEAMPEYLQDVLRQHTCIISYACI